MDSAVEKGKMYSSRRASATAGIANVKLVRNVCMNAVGQLARGERRQEARKSAGALIVQVCLERAHTHTHSLLSVLPLKSFM